MRYAVDTWAPDYGTSREEQLREASRPVDIAVEVPPDEWAPITPDPDSAVPDTITFVDGVRRIDARIWIADGAFSDKPGVCATVAAGAVRCSPGSATIELVVVERALYTSAGNAEPLDLGPTGRYDLRPLAAATDEALYLAVHNHMSKVEEELSHDLDEPGLVVFDGPLGVRDGVNAAGYIKSQHVQYLEDDGQQQVIGRLEPGQRTPLFHIGGDLPNWSWYMRLPGPRSHSMSGVVRVELPGLADVSCAALRADEITAALPRFASEAHKDARSPQNLYPIAGLERELRRRLGDATLLDRALRRHAAASEPSRQPA
ncbi:MAG: hypothetical protein ACR2QK_03380 [Acidimicrobiales bacterium]